MMIMYLFDYLSQTINKIISNQAKSNVIVHNDTTVSSNDWLEFSKSDPQGKTEILTVTNEVTNIIH